MVTATQHTTTEQTAHQDFAESLKQMVIEETDGGRRIIEAVASIMDGDAHNCTPWHQLEAAKFLNKLGSGDPQAILNSVRKQSRNAAPADSPSPTKVEDNSDHSCDIKHTQESTGDELCPSSSSMSDERVKLNKKLVRQIRINTNDGASMVKFLTDVMDGYEPDAKVRDRIRALEILVRLCFENPAQPDAEFMMQYARCHPECFCVCADLPADHPEVVKMHTPPTAEQREQQAEQQARQEEWDRETDELIERKKRADKERKLEEFHSPAAFDDRRIEREEQRKRRQTKREREKERGQEIREQIGQETRMDIWHHKQQEKERQRARSP